MFTYREIWAVLAKLEEEYNKTRIEGKTSHERKFAHNAVFVLGKVDKSFREELRKKRNKNEKNSSENKPRLRELG